LLLAEFREDVVFVLIDAIRPGAGAEGSTNGATFGQAGAGSAADRRTPAGHVALILNNIIGSQWMLQEIYENITENTTAKCSSFSDANFLTRQKM
jgi:hypothetical protein